MNRERQNEIAKLIQSRQTVSNAELMERFGISIETVRRDLAQLEKQGVLERVYGGAVRKSFLNTEPEYIKRQQEQLTEKLAIATTAAPLLRPHDTVFFDIGTTVLALAEQLDSAQPIAAFTSSLRVAMLLSENGHEVTITGGKVRCGELSASGFIAEQSMQQFNFDKAVIGAAGIDEHGITDFIPEEANLRRQIIQNARTVIVVADSSKFGTRAVCNICDMQDIDILVTDAHAPHDILKKIEKQGVTVLLA